MGLKLLHIYLLQPVLSMGLQKADAKVLLLGKQDLYFTYDELSRFLRLIKATFLEVPEAERRTTDSFGFVSDADWWRYCGNMHQATLFRMFGFRPENVYTLDVDDYEGAGIVHDMNLPIPDQWKGAYDIIIDCGTIEHVFNIQQAFWNINDFTGPGGTVFHLSPVNILEHGFVNLNATLLDDFYSQAGWSRAELCYVIRPVEDVGENVIFSKVPPSSYETPPGNHYIGLLGRYEKRGTTKNVTPKQGLYVALHGAWRGRDRSAAIKSPPAEHATGPSLVSRLKKRLKIARAVRVAKSQPGEATVILIR